MTVYAYLLHNLQNFIVNEYKKVKIIEIYCYFMARLGQF